MNTARILAPVLLVALVGCASGGSSGGSSDYTEAPAGSALARVEVEMTDAEVRKILGEPDNSKAYMTGKQFIPWYFGPDTHRTDWMYRGQGRVVFSRNRYTGGLKVINVLYSPAELQ